MAQARFTIRRVPPRLNRELRKRARIVKRQMAAGRERCRYADAVSGRRCDSRHLLQDRPRDPYAPEAARSDNLMLLYARIASHPQRHAGPSFTETDHLVSLMDAPNVFEPTPCRWLTVGVDSSRLRLPV